MKFFYSIAAGSLALIFLITGGCMPSTSGNVYSRGEAKTLQRAQYGTVIYVREVAIEGTSTFGTIAGGAMGYVLGGAVGSGSGTSIARTGGAIAGAVAGGATEQAATTQPGLEITVELANRELIVVVQAADENFKVGDSVRVITRSGGAARVVQ